MIFKDLKDFIRICFIFSWRFLGFFKSSKNLKIFWDFKDFERFSTIVYETFGVTCPSHPDIDPA